MRTGLQMSAHTSVTFFRAETKPLENLAKNYDENSSIPSWNWFQTSWLHSSSGETRNSDEVILKGETQGVLTNNSIMS